MRRLVAGNWKMNGLGADLAELAALKAGLGGAVCDVLVCPPATLIARAAGTAGATFAIGGQNCHAEPRGAFTGEISAEMLKDAGASFVILGHSERRRDFGETDAMVAAKTRAAWRAGLKAVVCIGEVQSQREAGHAERVCHGQITASVPPGANAANTVIAYEPVWAIGTGRTPTCQDIAAMHAHIVHCLRKQLGEAASAMPVLYGGSVNPSNAGEILSLPAVGGALVGGASLKAKEFLGIVAACGR
jgi:triosephosphate isomerase